uniref:Uncharacterized protein n=1 Tax=Hucho hucho TaxID=62062 RepID=A0A4W5QX30_9TELE
MVGIDGTHGSGNGSDWFCCNAIFHAILPKRYCQKHNIQLIPPPGYDWKTVTWAKYLEEKGTIAAPDGSSHGFAQNIKLEAVDLMEPRLVCVATMRRCVGLLLLHLDLDGWEPDFDQWVDFQSPDIYPVGFCEVTGYQLQPPIGPDPVASRKKHKPMGKNKKMMVKKKLANLNSKNRPPSGPSQQFEPEAGTPKQSDPTTLIQEIKAEPEEQKIIAVRVEMETPIAPTLPDAQVPPPSLVVVKQSHR